MFINIKVSSKNKKSLQKFLNIFMLFCSKNRINFFVKYFSQKQKTRIYTILKSPHVNKRAQEQFEYRMFSKQINIFSFQIFKFMIVLKKFQTQLFPDIKINIKFILNINKLKKQLNIFFDPNKFKLKTLKKKKHQLKINDYLKLLDIYGEISFAIV